VQSKLRDSTGAKNSFERAISIYENQLKKEKGKDWQANLRFKWGLVQNFLGNRVPVSYSSETKGGITTTTSMNISDAESVNGFVEKLMTYNTVEFF